MKNLSSIHIDTLPRTISLNSEDNPLIAKPVEEEAKTPLPQSPEKYVQI